MPPNPGPVHAWTRLLCQTAKNCNLLNSLENYRYGFSATDTECGQAVAQMTFMQFPDNRQGQTGTAGADRMADGTGTAIDVDLFLRQTSTP